MNGREAQEAQKRADLIVDKVRALISLENQVLEAREASHELSVEDLEARLKACVEELRGIADELKWATPCFRAYVLPQIGDIMRKHKSFDSEERKDLVCMVSTLMEAESTQSSEQLTAEIIARLRENIERSFGTYRA